MTKINVRTMLMTTLVSISPVFASIVLYKKLPQQMPVHFNLNNEPDNFAPKFIAAIILPILLGLLCAVICVLTDLKSGKKRGNEKINVACKWIIPVMSVAINGAVLMISLGKSVNIGKVCCIFISLTLIVLGNYLPKSKRNSVIGVRTPLTLSDDLLWYKTNRLCGILSVLFGFAILMSTLLPVIVMAITVISYAVVLTLVAIIYPVYLKKRSHT